MVLVRRYDDGHQLALFWSAFHIYIWLSRQVRRLFVKLIDCNRCRSHVPQVIVPSQTISGPKLARKFAGHNRPESSCYVEAYDAITDS